MYVSNNPLKYVDPSGHDGAKSLRDKINAPYIGMSTAAEELYDPVLEQQRKDKWERFVNGANNAAKGFFVTTSGVIIVYFMPAAIPEWLQLVGGTLGLASIGMGLSDLTEGTQELYFSATGDTESKAVNPVEEIVFGGNDAAYDVAEILTVSSAALSGLASAVLAEVTAVNAGNIANYANSVSQRNGTAVQSGAGIDFDLSKLSRSQLKAIESVDNIINDHLKSSDLSAALGDLQGHPIANPNGGYWNHAQEVKDAYTGLVRAEKTLAGSLQNPNLASDVREFIQGKYDSIIKYIRIIEEMFAPYGGIN